MFGRKEKREREREERALEFNLSVLSDLEEMQRRMQEYTLSAQRSAEEAWSDHMARVLIER